MSDYGKGSRRCPEDWRKVHRRWPFGKKRKIALDDRKARGVFKARPLSQSGGSRKADGAVRTFKSNVI